MGSQVALENGTILDLSPRQTLAATTQEVDAAEHEIDAESVLDIGCGNGDLLSALGPKRGVGVDLSREMIEAARRRYPQLTFFCADAQTVKVDGAPFEIIILSDVLNDLWDVQAVLVHLKRYCGSHTRIIFNVQSHLWETPRRMAEAIGAVTPNLP